MADILSTEMTNYSATPRVRNNPGSNGTLKSAHGALVAPVTTTGIGDTLSFFTVPSNASPRALYVSCGSAHTGAAMDIGLYYTPDAGGAVVDVDLFASALVTASGLTGATQLLEAGTYTFSNVTTPLWEAAGLSADPGGLFVVAATLTSAVATDALNGPRAGGAASTCCPHWRVAHT